MLATRYLFLTRHGEAAPTGDLTDAGRQQAVLLGRRLREVPITAVHHGPLPRASQTAALLATQLPGVPIYDDKAAGDFVPYTPMREELPETSGDLLHAFARQLPPADEERAADAERRFTGPVPGAETRYEVLVTHNFLAGWLVRASQDAPPWRWLALDHANAALTVIRYSPRAAGRAADVQRRQSPARGAALDGLLPRVLPSVIGERGAWPPGKPGSPEWPSLSGWPDESRSFAHVRSAQRLPRRRRRRRSRTPLDPRPGRRLPCGER